MRQLARHFSISFFFLSSLIISACGTLEVGIESTPVVDDGLQKTIAAIATANMKLATQIAKPSATHTPPPTTQALRQTPAPSSTNSPPTSRPTETTTPGLPRFTKLYFSTQPDGSPQRFFVEDIQRVYAIWNYENMNVGMVFRRRWEKDGELWSERSSNWDMERYGSQGIMRDFYIYDFDYGLQPGKYRFTLEINGIIQDFGENGVSQKFMEFWVVPSDITGPVVSPNRNYSIFILWGGRITIRDPDDNFRDLVTHDEIAQVAWFPDNRHIVYTARDRTGQVNLNSDAGITHELWILDVITGERARIGSAEDNFHHPVISPRGRYIALLSGNTSQENCQASPTLVFIEIAPDFQAGDKIFLSRFNGLPFTDQSGPRIASTDPNRPGYWEDDQLFIASLEWSCQEPNSQIDGVYLLNMLNFKAERLRE